MLTLMLPFLWNVGLKAYFFDSFSLVQLKMAGWWHFITCKTIHSYFLNFAEIWYPRSWNCPIPKLCIFGHKMWSKLPSLTFKWKLIFLWLRNMKKKILVWSPIFEYFEYYKSQLAVIHPVFRPMKCTLECTFLSVWGLCWCRNASTTHLRKMLFCQTRIYI